MNEQETQEPQKINTEGGAHVQGDVKAKTFVGRDQHIYYIALVGQMLDWANAEQLLPAATRLPSFDTLAEAFSETFSDQGEPGPARAVAFAGDILREPLEALKPAQPLAPVAYKKALPQITTQIGEHLAAHGFWDAYARSADGGDLLELVSLSTLWNRNLSQNRAFGLEQIAGNFYLRSGLEGQGPAAWEYVDYKKLRTGELQIVLVGLVIDLIRIAQENIAQANWVARLIEALSAGRGKE